LEKHDALLLLEDGTCLYGSSAGSNGVAVGEVVFNTSMTGYQEISTDPSYHSQIITFTNPHIGNTGINDEDFESQSIHASGLIFRDREYQVSSWRSQSNVRDFLLKYGVVAISNIDTRMLTKKIRQNGAMNGCILAGQIEIEEAKSQLLNFDGLVNQDLAIKVTTKKVYEWKNSLQNIYNRNVKNVDQNYNVVVYDFGVKHNILRILKNKGCKLTVVPADHPIKKVLDLKPDGVFLSNGPGDPQACGYAIDNIKTLLANKIPTFGICLGFQLLALSLGAKTKKMKFGHHGANHPVLDLSSKKVLITSQNHGFEVDTETLPKDIKITHKSLFDQSLQGFESVSNHAYGFQGHPEASPGPHDIKNVFDKFFELMDDRYAS
tara:strand:- start:1186 stop:2319 length:1134 start_codon:yes stop_codon:yes gene_type:complete